MPAPSFSVILALERAAIYGRRLASQSERKGGDSMVTYDGLFQFVIMLVAVVTLVKTSNTVCAFKCQYGPSA